MRKLPTSPTTPLKKLVPTPLPTPARPKPVAAEACVASCPPSAPSVAPMACTSCSPEIGGPGYRPRDA